MNRQTVARTQGSTSRPCRRALANGMLALGLTASGMADACTLDALLRLPLERLLELRIGAQRLSHGAGPEPTHGLPNHGGHDVA